MFRFFLLVNACTTTRETAPGLTIYTGRDKDEVAHVIDLFTQKFPQYKDNINMIMLGAQAALDRLRAEAAAVTKKAGGRSSDYPTLSLAADLLGLPVTTLNWK